MTTDLRRRFAAIFQRNPTLLAVDFTYAGRRRRRGRIRTITCRDRSGLPLPVEELTSPPKTLPAVDELEELLFHLVQQHEPTWCLGLGSTGRGTINRRLQFRILHTAKVIDRVTREVVDEVTVPPRATRRR